ncbi:MAG: hypothetical protein M1829_002012 [Trizodia sp. TS-e1964]|nr:MAG: hypothetical protein M1829_002012 [Trizodia sp. TS-e1964]
MDDDTNYRGISIPKIVDQIALHGDGIHGYYRAGDGQGSNGFRVLQVLRGGAPIIALSSFLGDCRSMNIKNWRLPSEGLAPFDCTLLTGQILFELLFPVKAGGPLKTIWWIGSVDKGTLTVTGNKMFVKATTGNSPGRKSLSLNWSQINLNDHMQFLTQLGLLQMNPLALLADEDAFTTLCRQVVSDEVIAQQDPFISATDLIVKQLKSPTSQTVLAEIYPPWAALWKPLTELDN